MKRPWRIPMAAAALAALGGLLALVLPEIIPVRDPSRRLEALRDLSRTIQRTYAALARDQEQKLDRLTRGPFPDSAEAQFARMKSIPLDPEIEGIALYTPARRLQLWLGRVSNLEEVLSGPAPALTPSFRPKQVLVRDKASSFLALVYRLESGTTIALYRLLSFVPDFQSAYLKEAGFLPARLRRRATLDFWDFREDLSGFERIFARHANEYVAQTRLPDEMPSIFFPLRTSEGRIVATVNLRASSPAATRAALREHIALAALLALAAALLLTAIVVVSRTAVRTDRRTGPALAVLGLVLSFRAVWIPMARLGPAAEWKLFSPAAAGFLSLGPLTRSPLDIVLTALVVFLISAGASVWAAGGRLRRNGTGPSAPLSPAASAMAALPPVLLAGAALFIDRMASHSGINLLRFDIDPAFLLLQAGVFLIALAAAVPSVVIFRRIFSRPGRIAAGAVLAASEGVLLAAGLFRHPSVWAPQAAALGLCAAAFIVRRTGIRRTAAVAAALAAFLAVDLAILRATTDKTRRLAEGVLRETILSHESWARFLLEESSRALDKAGRDVLAALRSPEASPSAARRLWGLTPAARFNWYSGLEIQDPGGNPISRFALNVPETFRITTDLPARTGWTVIRAPLPFMGREKPFFLGYRDWKENGKEMGRTILYISLDDDLLPFLYSANPYFELLRPNALPSLVQFDFRFAIFDTDGRIRFNPDRLSTGLPLSLLSDPRLDGPGQWSVLRDKGRNYRAFVFRRADRVFAILTPAERLLGAVVAFLKLLFLFALFALPAALVVLFLPGRASRRPPLWSFANRVYVSFVLVALVPLLLLGFFSRSFFDRVFVQQFIEKAEIHATMARNVMDDFIFLQREDPGDTGIPPEDLVLWISTTIANDVNLYRDGRLVSSSRRELFEAGLLPELLDGEIHYRIRFENHPYYAQTRSLGAFSYQTLTVPYTSVDPPLLISLPFPFEQQEVEAAGRDLLEFLVLVGAVFIAVVLLLGRGTGAMIVTPVRRLLSGTREAALGNLEVEVEYRGRDEMKTLVDGFNAMIRSLKDHRQELADLGRKAAWAEMARKVAHEIKNPLTPIQLSAEHILRVWEDGRSDFGPALKESLSYIVSEVENLRRIAQEFLDLSKESVLHRQDLDLGALLGESAEPYRKLLAERIAFVETYEPGLVVSGDRAKLKIAFRNLLINAVESIRGRGEVRISAQRSGDAFRIALEDTGTGIPAPALERIFEPYFSTKEAGTGLGLPISKKIIEDHGGAIRISSPPGRGTRAEIDLPAEKTSKEVLPP